MAAHVGRINAAALIGVGAAFDFLSGSKRQAPRWMQRSGLEWLFRLMMEPRRLWRRYATNIPAFLGLFLAQLLGLRRYRLDRVDTDTTRG
jgi:N-acetylglucosaminyldiphosphoundecaprenol N-acetyl-beta-D-mannosaminyltransferase